MKPSEQVKLKSDNYHPVIALVVHSGFAARYLLRTKIYRQLCELGARVIILTPNANEPYFREEFENSQTTVVPLDVQDCTRVFKSRIGHNQLLLLNLYASPVLNPLVEQRFLRSIQSRTRKKRIQHGLQRLAVRAIRSSRWARRVFFKLQEAALTTQHYQQLLERYQPDVVVATSPGYVNWAADAVLIHAARKKGIKTVAAIFAWDNPTTKGLPAAVPEFGIAWSETMKQELNQALDIGLDRIFVSGPAIFDIYAKKLEQSREQFCEQFGLDPQAPIIFFVTNSPGGFPYNPTYLRALARFLDKGRDKRQPQLMVRLHPNYFRPGSESDLKADMPVYQALAQEFPFIRYSIPNILSQSLRQDMAADEMEKVTLIVRHSDVVVNFFSTLQLEAAICDKPFVSIAFDIESHAPEHARPSEYPLHIHNRRAVANAAGKVAKSIDELVEYVNFYLDYPEADRSQRYKFMLQECGVVDGRAGVRTGELIYRIASSESNTQKKRVKATPYARFSSDAVRESSSLDAS